MTTSGPGEERSHRLVVALCFMVLTLEGYDLIVFGSTVPALLAHQPWGLDPERVGFLGSVAVTGMLFGALVSGFLTDAVGRRRVLIGSVALFSAAMVGCATAPTVDAFVVARLAVGLGAGCLLPSAVALVIEYSPVDRRNFNAALAFAGTGVGGIVSGLVALGFVPDGRFRPVYLVGGLPALLLVPVLIRYLPESRAFVAARDASDVPSARGVLRRIRSLFRDGYAVPTVVFWVVTFLNLLVLFGTNTWLPSLMAAAGFGISSALTFLLVLNVGAVVGALLASRLADGFGPRPIVAGAFCSAAVAFAALSLHPAPALAYVLIALAGFGATGTQILVNAYVGGAYPADRRATGLGLSLGVGRLGGVLGPTVGGYLIAADLSQRANFLAFAVPAVIAGVLVGVTPVPRAVTPVDAGAGRTGRGMRRA
jgi:AAHS family benzoate transporter-like MFS transporter